ncbi:hypothetical protein ACROYT_G020269 [Oculina patagonica]
MEDISHANSSQKTDVGIVKQGTPTGDELEELGQKIAGDWKKLGRRLDINDAKLQEIHEAHDQLSERGYHMLKHWKQERGSAATYQALLGALQHKLVLRQDLAEQFCYIHGTCAIQLLAVPVPEEKETRKNPPATAATCEIGASSKDKKESSKLRSGLKRKRSKPNPERGNLSFKIRCASAVSRNSEKHDPKQARKKVDCYMGEKVDKGKRTFDIYSHKGLEDFYAYLRGHLQLWIENSENSSIKITVKCRTLEILERLWDDYLSGHLNAVAEECLITEKVKDELDMETITLTTTILEEDYLACKLSLMEISDEASADDGQDDLGGDLESREQEYFSLFCMASGVYEASAGDGQVELRGDLESREHELEELEEPTACADVGQVELRGDLESREQELEELKELTGLRLYEAHPGISYQTHIISRYAQWQQAPPIHQPHCQVVHTGRMCRFTTHSCTPPTGNTSFKKLMNIRDVKRYLNVATIVKDGLLVVKRNEPLAPTRECIIVPRKVLERLLTALHIQLGHPSSHQLKAATKCYLYTLGMVKAIDRASQAFHNVQYYVKPRKCTRNSLLPIHPTLLVYRLPQILSSARDSSY